MQKTFEAFGQRLSSPRVPDSTGRRRKAWLAAAALTVSLGFGPFVGAAEAEPGAEGDGCLVERVASWIAAAIGGDTGPDEPGPDIEPNG